MINFILTLLPINLIINDGSVDETEEIARAWGVQHVVHFKRNLGLARGSLIHS